MLRGLVVDAGFSQPPGRFVDGDGKSLDTPDDDEELYGDDDFPRGDIWFQARKRKPLDMSEEDLGQFVRLIQKMLQWEPENRPFTGELLQDPWLNSAA
ncbi:uncharacterized protein PG998_014591 [Apiospora kogelbergensis]|uniref:uncharacterized protein n=1 Tax=Apiospora kogelbergensis TaxID=1337665 RepID=UPI00312E9139